MKFEEYRIANEIKQNLLELGYKRPTDIQFRAIPSILNGDDVMAIAQTGTGKTAAFAIPIVHKLLTTAARHNTSNPRCLVMVPTRELAIQIAEAFQKIAANTQLHIVGIWGGVNQDEQIAALHKGADVLIATPGRMFDLIHQRAVNIKDVSILVLDEADLMLAYGFNKDIQDVVRLIPARHQTLFFSATISPEIKKLAYAVVDNPIRIQIAPKDPVSKNVTHALAFVAMEDKRYFLERLVREQPEAKILVFVRTKVRAERVHSAMARMGIESLTMHGGKDQEDRLQVLQAFKEGSVNMLITTDLSARGIHIDGVNYVVNYDLPDVPENYVHRVGRTGRGMQKGFAVSYCAPEEQPLLADIEKFLGNSITLMKVDKSDYLQTIQTSHDIPNTNWQLLLDEAEIEEKSRKQKKKK